MKSYVLPSFWNAYNKLGETVQGHARRAYRLWGENPFHPSLHFKCINTAENIWSIRIGQGYRALGVWEADTVTWFWIGNHHDYDRFISQ